MSKPRFEAMGQISDTNPDLGLACEAWPRFQATYRAYAA